MGRKPRYATEEERHEAQLRYLRAYWEKNKAIHAERRKTKDLERKLKMKRALTLYKELDEPEPDIILVG